MQNSNISLICCTSEVYFLLCDNKKRNRLPNLNCDFVKRQTFVNSVTLTELIRVILDQLSQVKKKIFLLKLTRRLYLANVLQCRLNVL